MGHWERYVPIAHLAEAAGIRDAIETFDFSVYEGPISIFGGDLAYVCAVRGKHARENGQTPIGPVGQLYACIYGDKYLVGSIHGHQLDMALGGEDYSTYFEDIDPELVEKAKKEHPSLCQAAQERMNKVLEHIVSESEVSSINHRADAIELRPKIAKFLRMHGPATYDDFSRASHYIFYNDWLPILQELVKEGFLNEEVKDGDCLFSLTEAADQMLSDYEPLEIPTTPEDKLIAVLREKGPLPSSDISFHIGSNVQYTRELLRKLADKGTIEARGRGRSRKYALA